MLSVIIPVYNERRTIREIIRRVCAVDIVKQLIIVDDGSTDGTNQVVRALEKEAAASPDSFPNSTFAFICVPKNRGKSAAIRAAIPHATGSITLIQDADLEYDPADYPRLLEPILKGRADVVYGSRFTGNDRRVLYFWNSVANKTLTLISNILTNLNLTDVETGYKVFRTPLLKGIPLRSNRFGFEPEVTAKIAKLGCRIYEVPIAYYGRTYAQGKKIRLKDAFSALYTMVKYWLIDDLYTSATAGLRTLHIMQGAGRYNEWLFAQVRPFLGNHVVEMGSGVGNMTGFLLDRELLIATDIADSCVLELGREYGSFPNVNVRTVDFGNQDSISASIPERDIDTVLSMNVLEHIEHDKAAIEGCFTVLKNGGKLVLLVPAHAALYSTMDRQIGHFRRYSRVHLRALLTAAGFSVIEERYCNMLGALGWFVNGRIFKRNLVPSRQLRFFNLAIGLLSLERIIRPRFGLGLLMVAEKPGAVEIAP